MSMNVYENKPFRVYDANYFRGDDDVTSSVGVYFITDKQSLFQSNIRTRYDGGREEFLGHDEILKNIDRNIYKDNEMDSKSFRRPYNAYILLSKDYYSGFMQYLVSLPENGQISLSQYMFLMRALNELNEYNEYEYLPEDKCKYISVLGNDEEQDDLSVEEAKKVIKKFIIGKQKLHEENVESKKLGEKGIVSELLSEEEIISAIKFYVDFSKCNTFSELARLMNLCDKYYHDNYYHSFFIKLFPNYEEVSLLFERIKNINLDSITFSNLSFENVYDVLSKICEDYGYNSSNKGR